MGYDSVASSYPISTGLCSLMGCQQDPKDRGVTAWYQSIGTRVPRA